MFAVEVEAKPHQQSEWPNARNKVSQTEKILKVPIVEQGAQEVEEKAYDSCCRLRYITWTGVKDYNLHSYT